MAKSIEFLGDSLDALRAFPQNARQSAGFQLDLVQQGCEPNDWKPMPSVGSGVNEIRVRDSQGQFRVLYVAKLKDVVYVLHCFQKKTQKTAKSDLDLATTRFKELMWRLR